MLVSPWTNKMAALPPDEIHLWLSYYDQIDDELLLQCYRALLSESEKRQEKRFYFDEDRRRYLITRALARTVLSRYMSGAPAGWVFSSNAYGRPELANPAEGGKDLSFNISHTHSLIALAVSRNRVVGLDVENILSRSAYIDIANHYFAPEEVASLHDIPAEHRQHRFFEYWTFKESYIKARGMGLQLPLHRFSFHFPHAGSVRCQFEADFEDDVQRWQFWQMQPSSQYLIAMCAERTDSEVRNVVVRNVIPHCHEDMIVARFTRICSHGSAKTSHQPGGK